LTQTQAINKVVGNWGTVSKYYYYSTTMALRLECQLIICC